MRRASRLGAIDHAWLRMDRPENPMMITGVLTFDGPLDMARLRATIEERLAGFPRFRQRVVPGGPGRRARWQDDPSFDVAAHVGHRMLPPPADRETLRRAIGELVSTRLASDRPLWRLDALENPRDGRTVLVCRLHHCIADGFALMHVMLTLTDGGPEPSAREPLPPQATPSLGGRLREGLERARRARDRPGRGLGSLALGAAAVARDLLHLATLPNQPATLLRAPLGGEKRAAWSEPIPLDEVRAIGRALGGTINDVLMAAAAGAIASYLREHRESPAGFDLRAAVPVNLRSPAEMRELGNHFGLVFLDLPLQPRDPHERFDELKRRMDALKRSPEPFVLLALMQITGAGPGWLEELVVRILGAKTTAVLTNVPGPSEPRFLAGQRIRTIMFWVPQSGRVGLGISIFSYAGEVRLGVSADARLVPDPDRILDAFPAEIRALRAAAGLR